MSSTATPATAVASATPKPSAFKSAILKMISIAEKVKAEVIKAATAVDGVAANIANDAPEIEAVANAFVPGASKYVDLGLSLLEGIAKTLDAGGAAAATNLTNFGLDTALIAAVQSEVGNIKALAKGA